LPFRGPRPKIKGEEPLELRLMDDIVIPRSLAQMNHPDRPPYASFTQPSGYSVEPQASAMQLATQTSAITRSEGAAIQPTAAVETAGSMQVIAHEPNDRQTSERYTVLVLKSNQVYELAKYERDGDLLMFQDVQGRKGGVDVKDVDWRRTAEMTGEAHSGNAQVISRQTN
jgi:hypothetical protein